MNYLGKVESWDNKRVWEKWFDKVNTGISWVHCDNSHTTVEALLYRAAPTTWYTADRHWGKTTSGRAGFPSVWLGPILPLIRNWLVYWSILPIISHSPQLPSPLTTDNWLAIMICALPLHPHPSVLTQQWVKVYAWPTYWRGQGDWGKDGKGLLQIKIWNEFAKRGRAR